MFLPALLLAQAPAPKTPATPAAPKAVTSAPSMTDDDKIVYSLGLYVYRSLGQFDLSPAEMEILKQAMTDAAANKPAVELSTWGPKIQTLASARGSRVAGREKAASAAYLTKAAAEPGAVKTASGLIYRELTAGAGASPKATDNVKVHYRGTLINGTEFDSSYSRNMPAEFTLNGVIPCWTEGVQRMKVGGKAQLVCPSDIAYGDQGRPPTIGGGATLVFEVELLNIGGAEPAK
ncbi:MAG: FKBP-type peptidyl-prolyl cis-trans isomerase [Acidobacteriota bacterium]|nr:FKBP-type peptidyl-prolyl cis-trans isomerase [Acidobacteriota bacterium]